MSHLRYFLAIGVALVWLWIGVGQEPKRATPDTEPIFGKRSVFRFTEYDEQGKKR